jgi:hypothetical protein
MSPRLRSAAVVLSTLLAVVLISPAALADPIPDLDGVNLTNDADGSSGSSGGSSAASYAQVLNLDVGGNDVLDVGHSSASSSSSDGDSADSTVLGIAGREIAGAHAEDDETDETGLLLELCGMTDGFVCLGLIYAYATAGGGSASSDSAVLDACVGGDDAERRSTESCAGLLWLSILDSHADASSDDEGAAASETSNGVAACVGGHDDEGACSGLGLRVLHSESSASSNGDSEGGSYVLGIEQDGDETTVGSQEVHVDVPPGCPAGTSVICLALNQGGAEAGSNQQTLAGIEILPGEDDAAGEGQAFDGATSASSEEPGEVSDAGPSKNDEADPATRAPRVKAAPGGALPFTGAGLVVYLLLGLAAVAVGSTAIVAAERRTR